MKQLFNLHLLGIMANLLDDYSQPSTMHLIGDLSSHIQCKLLEELLIILCYFVSGTECLSGSLSKCLGNSHQRQVLAVFHH